MLLWLLRVTWLALPFTVGTAAADALRDRSASVQVTAAVVLWLGWAIALVALLVPRPAGLVVARVAPLGAVALGVLAADDAADWLGVAVAVGALAAALTPMIGEWFVNGTSYGYERRYLLRAPGPLVLGPIAVAAGLLLVAVTIGPLLLAARQWVAGALCVIAGGAVAYVLARALHSMTLRWAVLVPAGLVLKDHLAIADPVLFRRPDIDGLRRAPADTSALDLTAGALGIALELRLRAAQQVDPVRSRRPTDPVEVTSLLFTPTRPAALLADAATRRVRAEV